MSERRDWLLPLAVVCFLCSGLLLLWWWELARPGAGPGLEVTATVTGPARVVATATGTVVVTPTIDLVPTVAGTIAPTGTAVGPLPTYTAVPTLVPTGRVGPTATATVGAGPLAIVTVAPGDTLSHLALWYYGRAVLWPRICAENGLVRCDRIFPRQELVIP